MSTKKQAVVNNNGELPIIGKLAIYNLGETKAPVADLKSSATRHGFPENLLPSPINMPDAFRKSCTAATKRQKGIEPISLRYARDDREYMVAVFEKKIAFTNEDIEKALNDEAIEPRVQHIATAVLDKRGGGINLVPIVDEGNEVLDRVRAEFSKNTKYYDVNTMRRMVNNSFDAAHGIRYRRNGGVSFIPNSGLQTIEALCKVLRDVAPECSIDLSIDIADTAGHRSAVQDKLKEHMFDEISEIAKNMGCDKEIIASRTRMQDVIADFKRLLSSKEIGEKQAENAVLQFQAIKGTISDYRDLLEVNLETLNDQVEIIQKQMKGIMEKAADARIRKEEEKAALKAKEASEKVVPETEKAS